MGLRSCRVESMPMNNPAGKLHDAKVGTSAPDTRNSTGALAASGHISPVAWFRPAAAAVAFHRPEYLHRGRAAVSAQALSFPFDRRVCRPDPARLQGRFLWASCSHLYCRSVVGAAGGWLTQFAAAMFPSRPETRPSKLISAQNPSTTMRSPPAPSS